MSGSVEEHRIAATLIQAGEHMCAKVNDLIRDEIKAACVQADKSLKINEGNCYVNLSGCQAKLPAVLRPSRLPSPGQLQDVLARPVQLLTQSERLDIGDETGETRTERLDIVEEPVPPEYLATDREYCKKVSQASKCSTTLNASMFHSTDSASSSEGADHGRDSETSGDAHSATHGSLHRQPSELSKAAAMSTTSDNSLLSLAPIWKQESTNKLSSPKRRNNFKISASSSSSLQKQSGSSQSEEDHSRNRFGTCIMRPSSPICIVWDLITATMLLHDIVMTPLSAFSLPESDVLAAFDLGSTMTWAADIPATFCRGFIDSSRGHVEMRVGRIASAYLKGWFFMDVTIVAVDLFFLLADSSDWLNVFTFLRFFRVLRLLRILRILKLSARLVTISEVIGVQGFLLRQDWSPEYSHALVSVVKQLLVIVFLCHYVACGWFSISTVSQRTHDTSWAVVHERSRMAEGVDSDWDYMYASSFHWAISQFTPASVDANPTNTIERFYAITIILGGLLVFSSFIGNISQSMTTLRLLNAKERQQAQSVRRYLHEHNVSAEVSHSLLSFMKRHRIGKSDKTNAAMTSEIINRLPRTLKNALDLEVFLPHLTKHPLIERMQMDEWLSVTKICSTAITERTATFHEEVFQPQMSAGSMYILLTGSMSYKPEFDFNTITLTGGDRVSEICLWAVWNHRGFLSGEAVCSQLLELDAGLFQVAMGKTDASATFLKMYASTFLKKCAQAGLSLWGDLFGGNDDVQDIVWQVSKYSGSSSLTSAMISNSDTFIQKTVFVAWRDVSHRQRPWRHSFKFIGALFRWLRPWRQRF